MVINTQTDLKAGVMKDENSRVAVFDNRLLRPAGRGQTSDYYLVFVAVEFQGGDPSFAYGGCQQDRGVGVIRRFEGETNGGSRGSGSRKVRSDFPVRSPYKSRSRSGNASKAAVSSGSIN